MVEKYTFLYAPIDAVGHFNACIGVAQRLKARGHTVVFATPLTRKGQLEAKGFIEECYACSAEGEEDPILHTEKWGEMIAQMAPVLAMDGLGQAQHLLPPLYQEALNQVKYSEAKFAEIMGRVKPDVVVVDNIGQNPALVNSGTPWVFASSLSPLFLAGENLPPAFSGLPTDCNQSVSKSFYEKQKEATIEIHNDFKAWLAENGGPKNLKYQPVMFHTYSPYANIYMSPKELDYAPMRPLPANWYGFDAFMRMRTSEESFQIPKELDGKPGKLIYFSMGTIGCSELGLMRKLVAILAKSPHRFIVSKGPLADKYELADNMWGEPWLPQTNILPLVDLVITHGGNNTTTESFYYGKRVLVLPLFADQLDNGQRVFETGLGLQFHPYLVTEAELLEAIESLLNNDMLERRMVSIGERIRASNSQERAADVVESVAKKYNGKSISSHKG